jgi:hypothetical protein
MDYKELDEEEISIATLQEKYDLANSRLNIVRRIYIAYCKEVDKKGFIRDEAFIKKLEQELDEVQERLEQAKISQENEGLLLQIYQRMPTNWILPLRSHIDDALKANTGILLGEDVIVTLNNLEHAIKNEISAGEKGSSDMGSEQNNLIPVGPVQHNLKQKIKKEKIKAAEKEGENYERRKQLFRSILRSHKDCAIYYWGIFLYNTITISVGLEGLLKKHAAEACDIASKVFEAECAKLGGLDPEVENLTELYEDFYICFTGISMPEIRTNLFSVLYESPFSMREFYNVNAMQEHFSHKCDPIGKEQSIEDVRARIAGERLIQKKQIKDKKESASTYSNLAPAAGKVVHFDNAGNLKSSSVFPEMLARSAYQPATFFRRIRQIMAFSSSKTEVIASAKHSQGLTRRAFNKSDLP